MKRNSDSLFLLIKSMSKSEKRYFKLYSSTFKKGSNLAKLYDIIEQSNKYAGEEVYQKQYTSICKGKDFFGTKKKLYEQLIKSIRIYHFGLSVEGLIKGHIENSQLLWQRRLFEECAVEINKATELATNFEFFLLLLQAIELKTKINIRLFFPIEEILKIESEKSKIIKQYENFTQYQTLESSFGIIHNKNPFIRSKHVESLYSKIMNNPLIKRSGMGLSVKANIIRSSLLGIYNFAKCDFENSYRYTNVVINLIESNPGFEKMLQRKYVSSLGNALVSFLYLHRYAEMGFYIDKLSKIEPTDNDIAIRVYELKTIPIKAFLNIGDFKSALDSLLILENEMQNYFGKVYVKNQSIVFFYFALGNFGLNNFSLALKYLNQLLFFPGIEKNQHIYYFAQLLNLIIHYEKSNSEHVEYKIKSIYKYFYSHQQLYKFESLILLLLREAIYTNNKKELIALFEKYKTQFEKLLNDPFEKIAIEFFDIISWLESKITKKSFVEIVREKWEKEQST